MSKTIFLSLAFAMLGAMHAKGQGTLMAEMTFQEEVHDYGTIKQGSNGDCEFRFTNTGSAALIISDARGSCQCTVPEWPKTPIKPGETATIKVHYNTSRVGPINKTVTLTANVEGGTKVVRIKGNVIAAETPGVPLKTENMLKNDLP
ncbi:MAG TPA: DUF1573 domain-containing protein [Flavobacteriales bacterium]|nr:DUF1573 domain-containing protein [Flavobacteriales bacterium]